MNRTYLIFFGKSQDFLFHAFDSKSYINNFDVIIKDFDELESKIFTVDDVSNTQILSKYIFSKNGRDFSLLKLYSFAQAFSGNRIDGSIYGVGLLSEHDISISETNIAILKTAKEKFAELSLNSLKFNKSDFYPDVAKIWRAFIEHSNGNYLEKIQYNDFRNVSINKEVQAFLLKDTLKQSAELNDEIINTSRLYFSDDLEHLKRTQERRGRDVFPFYIKENGNWVLYGEKQSVSTTNAPTPSVSDGDISQKAKIGELERELEDKKNDFNRYKQSATKKIRIASIAAAVFCLIALAFFFTGHFSDTPPNNQSDTTTVKKDWQLDQLTQSPEKPQSVTVSLVNILADNVNRGTLSTLLNNIRLREKTKKKKNKKKYYEAIVRDAIVLGIDSTFTNKYKPESEVPRPE